MMRTDLQLSNQKKFLYQKSRNSGEDFRLPD